MFACFLELYVCSSYVSHLVIVFFFFQAEDGIRDLVRSRGLGDVYKRQAPHRSQPARVDVGLFHAQLL